MLMDNTDLLSWVKRGKNRKIVLKAIEGQMMPSELVLKVYGKVSNTSFNLVSRSLAELKEKGLVTVINPQEKTGRLYKLTRKGQKLKGEI